jgi:hypothetical protein
LKRIRDLIPKDTVRALEQLFLDFLSDSEVGEDWQIVGLPDFVVLQNRKSAAPFWVEVKRGATKLKKDQRIMCGYLKELGFRVEVWRGGPLLFD